ncbi:MAG TPA: LysM peptidoglycan-binding domain-containing protein [Anaerolineales bacterium]|nr:LysM peptidoglycan-binding domain-containing protein [Anaerolineales bacterium]
MSNLRQVLAGILAGLVSLIIILGSLSLALAEGSTSVASLPVTSTETPSPLPTTQPGAPTFTPSSIPQDTATTTPIPTLVCPIPPGWETILLSEGDDLEIIALERGISLEDLLAYNCMNAPVFLPETILYVPPFPEDTATPIGVVTETPTPTSAPVFLPTTAIPCGPPAGWITYKVQSGDTLYSISRAYYTTVFALQNANCLTGTKIITGQILYVPNVATRTPTPTPLPPLTFTPTNTPPTPTATPTNTSPPLPTGTTPPTNTSTPTETPAGTALPTETATPTATSIESPTPIPLSATYTPTNLSTSTNTPNPTPSDTPTP